MNARVISAVAAAAFVAALSAIQLGPRLSGQTAPPTASPSNTSSSASPNASEPVLPDTVGTITVTFDEHSAGTILTNQYPGLTFSSAKSSWSGNVTGNVLIVAEPTAPAGTVSCTSTSSTSNGTCVAYAGPASNGICAEAVGGGPDCRADVTVTFGAGITSLIYTVMGGYPAPSGFEFYDMFGNTTYNTFSLDHVEPRLLNVWKQTINRTGIIGSLSPIKQLVVSTASSSQATKGMANTGGLAIDKLVYTGTITCAMSVTTTTVPDGAVGVAYPATSVAQTGGNGTVTYSVLSGSLPPGVSLSAVGELSGTPTAVGVFDFTVKATDANSCTATKSYTVNVIGALEVLDPACLTDISCPGAFFDDAGELLLPEQLALALVPRTGAVTDGVTVLLLRVRTEVAVTIEATPGLGVPLKALTLWDGTPVTGPVTPDLTTLGKFAFAAYEVPTGLANTVTAGVVTFSAHTAALSGGATEPINFNLRRPLPVLVHGIWSNGHAWAGLASYLNANGLEVCPGCLVHYGDFDGGAPTFHPHAGSPSVSALANSVESALETLHAQGIAASQVDIVAHSMGGLVTRARASQDSYIDRANRFQGSFHRVITAGTPHLGTPLAEWIIRHQDEERFITREIGNTGFYETVSETLKEFVPKFLWGIPFGEIKQGVEDLRPGSAAIRAIGSSDVWGHAIAGIEPAFSPVETILNQVPAAFGYPQCTVDKLLGNNDDLHDVLVPLASQYGQLPGANTTPMLGTVHAGPLVTTETNSSAVFSRALALLTEPEPTDFAPEFPAYNGPSTVTLPADCPPPVTIVRPKPNAPETALAITLTPAQGTVAHAGDTVPVTFTIIGGAPVTGAIVTIAGDAFALNGAGPFTVNYQVPTGKVGIFDIVAETIGSSAADYGASTSFTVESLSPLASLAGSPSPLVLNGEGQQQTVTVTATFQDASHADVTSAKSGTTYSFLSGNTTVAGVNANGVVAAHASGQDTLVAHYGGMTANVPVSVSVSNHHPSVSAVAPIVIGAGSTTNVPFQATDPDNDVLSLVGNSLPSFVTVLDDGGGAGHLHIAPAPTDVGQYSFAVTAVDDGYPVLEGSRGVQLSVTLPPFTDDPIVAGQTIVKGQHVLELRARIDALRVKAGLNAFTWTDASLTAGVAIIKAQHVLDLRSALADVYTALPATPPAYTDPGLTTGTAVKAVHINELRAAVLAIE